MMKKIILFITLTLVTATQYAQDIELSYENAQIINDGTDDFYQVDVFVSANDPFKYGFGQFYITYNTAAFGMTPDADGDFFFEQPAGSLLDIGIDAAPAAKFFSGFNSSDNIPGIVSVNWQHGFAASTISENTVTSTPRFLCTVRFKYLNLNEDPSVCFEVDLTSGQNAEACGPFTSANPFELADCTNFGAVVRTNDTYTCTGAELPVELCTGGTTTFTTALEWDNGTPDETMTAIIEGSYNTLVFGDIEACELIITSTGDLFIASTGDDYVRVQNDIENEGAFTIGHRASLVQVNDEAQVINNGTIDVEVTTANVDVRDFVMLGSPVSLETREDVWSEAFNVQTFVPSLFIPFEPEEMGVVYNFQSEDLTVWDPKSGLLEAGVGYLVFPQNAVNGPGGTFDYTFNEGTLNNGVITQTLVYNGTPESSPNMLSNPYASAIDADQFFIENPTIDTVYFWEHGAAPSEDIPGPEDKNFSMRDVSAYNSTGGIMAASGAGTMPNGVISTSQGFGVFAPSAVDVEFNNSMRLTSGNTTLRTVEQQKDRLWLRIEDMTYGEGSNTLVGFMEGATSGFDARYDSPAIDNVVSLYSYIADDYSKGYTIQGRESFDENTTVQLGFNTTIEGTNTYKVSLSNFDGMAFNTHAVYITDNITGTKINLSENEYSFTATKGHFENRFLLSFKNNALDTSSFDKNSISLHPNPALNNILINTSSSQLDSIVIFDVSGRKVFEENNIDSDTTNLDITTLQSGVYLAQIHTLQGSATIKFIKK